LILFFLLVFSGKKLVFTVFFRGQIVNKITDVPKSLIREIFEVGNGSLDQPIRIIFACCDMLKCSPSFGEFKRCDENFRNLDGARRKLYQDKRAIFSDSRKNQHVNI